MKPDARPLARVRIQRHDLARVERCLDLEDPAGPLRRRGKVLLHEIHALDDDHVALRQDANDLALLTLLLSADDDHAVAFSDASHHSTSGARETIFMNFLP